jgi:alanine dehydrogenase
MIIACPKEIKTLENRVGLTPVGTKVLTDLGHSVYVERDAGVGAGFSNAMYIEAGAEILDTPKEIYLKGNLIVKVKEPLEPEYELIREGQIIFTYFHFASSKPLIEAMLAAKATCIAYETIEDKNGALPLLVPMSQIAGRLAVLEGIRYLTKPFGGLGILPGGIPGVAPAKITIIGGGMVGTEAAKVASGLGADVTVVDLSPNRLLYLSEILPKNVKTIFSNAQSISELVKDTDLLIGAVLIPGAEAPKLVSEAMVKTMKKGSVIVDVAIDQGGCVATSIKTSFEQPVVEKYGVIHYGVANMPGAVARTSTIALTQVTLPYLVNLANIGYKKLAEKDKGFAKGVNIDHGQVILQDILK